MRIVPVRASALGNSDSSFFVPDNKLYIQHFLMSHKQEMYSFDGDSTPITIVVIGAYFPSILLFDFYSVCLDTHVYNLYTVRKLALRRIQWLHFYSKWSTPSGVMGWMDSDDAPKIQTPLLPIS